MRARRQFPKTRISASEAPRENKIFLALRHPLTTLSVGFLFTIIIGGAISRHYDTETTKQRLIDSRISDSSKLTESAANYLAHTILMTQAIRKKEPEEQILAKKILYEKSKIDWLKNTFLLDSLSARTTTGYMNSESLAMRIKYTAKNALEAMDDCLLPALNEINIDNANSALDTCKKTYVRRREMA